MGKKGNKRKTRWRVLPICEDGEEATRRHAGGGSASNGYSSYRPPPPAPHQPAHQPTPARTISFNDDEYTKITTPRQDVLFKKGYLGRARPAPEVAEDAAAKVQNGEDVVSNDRCGLVNVPEEQYVYTNGFVDHGNMYYMNGDGYELCNFTVLVGPAPAPAPVLAAIPCQPLPLQPLEWFNPPTAFIHCLPHMHSSSESQNSGPQSSESPGSPEECEEVIACEEEPAFYQPHPPAYVYPGYMFGPPVFSMNGITIQGAPQTPPTEVISIKHHKKKRRRRRHQGTIDDGSEGSSSYEKESEKPSSQFESETSKDCEGASEEHVRSTNSPATEREVEDNSSVVNTNNITAEPLPQASSKDVQVSEEIAGITEEHLPHNSEQTEMYSSQNLICTQDSFLEVERSERTEPCHNAAKKVDPSISKSDDRSYKKHLSDSKVKKVKHNEKKSVSERTGVLNSRENTGRRSKKGNKGTIQNTADTNKKVTALAEDKGETVYSTTTTTCSSSIDENSVNKILSESKHSKNSPMKVKEKFEEPDVLRELCEETNDHTMQNGTQDELPKFSSAEQIIPTTNYSNTQEHLMLMESDFNISSIPVLDNTAEPILKVEGQQCNNQKASNESSLEDFSEESNRMQLVQSDLQNRMLDSSVIETHELLRSSECSELLYRENNPSNSTGGNASEKSTSVSEAPNETHTLLMENVSNDLHILNGEVFQLEDNMKHNGENKAVAESEMRISPCYKMDMGQQIGGHLHKNNSIESKSKLNTSSQITYKHPSAQAAGTDTNISIMHYAESKSAIIVKEALHEVQLRHFKNLKITEAVEKWLHSQEGKEIIKLAGIASRGTCESDEESEATESDEEFSKPIVPGPKNVLSNPLLASSLNFLYMDDASIRVAIKFCEECISLTNLIPHMKLLKFNSNIKCDNNPEKTVCSIMNFHGLTADGGLTFTVKNKKPYMVVNESLPKHHIQISIANDFFECPGKFDETEESDQKGALTEMMNIDTSLSVGINTCDTLDNDPEFYIWDADLLKKQLSCQTETEFKFESSDNVSCMCDPTLFVGKYYSLGLPVERNNYDSQTDTESDEEQILQSDSSQSWLSETSNSTITVAEDEIKSEEGIDVIEAMNQNIDIFEFNYVKFPNLNSGISPIACSHQKDINFVTSSGVNMSKTSNGLHHESAILMRHIKEKGPFPVGGICCMIQ